ncbi:hypothetical protein BH11VER1_BH11VER1_26660 [soil metagenome]
MAVVSAVSQAAPDFTQSAITVSSESPLEGDVVRFTVSLKNSGDAPAEFAQLKIESPLMGYLIEAGGTEELTVDPDSRSVTASLTLLPGAEKQIHVDVLAPRDSGGDALSLSVHLAHYASGAELWDHKTITIDTRLSATGILIGGFRIAPAGIAVLVWLVVFALLRLAVRLWLGASSGAAVAASMIAIGFWMVFAQMAYRDYCALNVWPETTGTIVGRRVVSQSVTSSSKSSAGTARTTSETYSPEFALRYKVNGRPILSTGYDTGSSLRFGGRARREQEMRDWIVGTEIPCWYDPDNPTDVVVHRGFGGAYLFALFPLPVFWMGLARLRRKRE